MYRKGIGSGHKDMCPYCGGKHPAGECPMINFPPAMPMPSVPMPPMGNMPAGGMPAGGMPMGGMPMGGMPMGGMVGGMMGGMPMIGDMIAGVQHHMATVERLLHEIHCCCMENNAMIKEMHSRMAKG